MKVYLIVLYYFLFPVQSLKQRNSKPLVELTAGNLTSNFNDWEYDVAIMFYAPWCKYCKQLAPYMEQISIELREKKELVVGKFNCEEPKSNVQICKELGITHYPSIQFVGYGDFNQAVGAKLFGKSDYPRLVRYNADILPDAIFDWIKMLSTMSWFHRKWDDFWGIFFPEKYSRLLKKVNNMKTEVKSLETQIAESKKKIGKYKADELFDSLTDKGDPFPLLQGTPSDVSDIY